MTYVLLAAPTKQFCQPQQPLRSSNLKNSNQIKKTTFNQISQQIKASNIDESRFRLFIDCGMPGLVFSKESATSRDRFGAPQKDIESYNGSGMGLSLFYFLNYDFSLIYQSISADLHQVSFTTDTWKSDDQQGKGR